MADRAREVTIIMALAADRPPMKVRTGSTPLWPVRVMPRPK